MIDHFGRTGAAGVKIFRDFTVLKIYPKHAGFLTRFFLTKPYLRNLTNTSRVVCDVIGFESNRKVYVLTELPIARTYLGVKV